MSDAPVEQPEEPIAQEGEHRPPKFDAGAYHCPLCGVLATMRWVRMSVPGRPNSHYAEAWHVRCGNCKQVQYWVADMGGEPRMVRPMVGGGPRPHVDMPEDVRADYEEARAIVVLSPRGACALLRLATEKLVKQLQPDAKDVNDGIGKLVAAGLPGMIQQAFDSLRVIGNEAVHAGTLDLSDDADTANGLFALLNVIVEDRITRPKHIAEMYAKLPAGKLQGIVARDKPKS